MKQKIKSPIFPFFMPLGMPLRSVIFFWTFYFWTLFFTPLLICSVDNNEEASKLEWGISLFLEGKFEESRKSFEESLPYNHPLSFLYLSRIDLLEGNPKEANKKLDKILPLLDSHDLLNYEIFYLKGEVYSQLHNYFKAAHFFEKAIPRFNPEIVEWYSETLYHLGWSYLKAIYQVPFDLKLKETYLEKATEAFEKFISISIEEKGPLALAQCYLTQANHLNKPEYYKKAEEILKQSNRFKSRESQTYATLLQAQAAAEYSIRDKFYRELTDPLNANHSFYAKGWYLRGLNDFEEGQKLLDSDSLIQSDKAFERAAASFQKGFELLSLSEPEIAGLCLKYKAQAYSLQSHKNGKFMAFSVLNYLTTEHEETILNQMKEPDEIYYLQALMASHLLQEKGENFAGIAEKSLKTGINRFPKSNFREQMWNLLGILYFHQEAYEKSEGAFRSLIAENQKSPFKGESLFWIANCLEKQQKSPEIIRQIRKEIYESYPHCKYSDEAYFLLYSYQDYLQGDRTALKHLENFQHHFPNSPFLLNSFYLMGLDYRRDRKTPEGKWIQKKNLKLSIDAFQEVATTFERLYQSHLLSPERMDHYTSLFYRATLERAISNLAIANESEETKKQIYLEYAENVFRQIQHDFQHSDVSFTKHLPLQKPYHPIEEENNYWLAQTYIKSHQLEKAKNLLHDMAKKYQAAKITRGYFLSQVGYNLGMIAWEEENYSQALQHLILAEDASKGKLLNSDQKLDLWIQQSLCYKGLQQLDEAILILSKVINDDAISSLRLKAMFLRAEMYQHQGRHKLARKQLEATRKKGGEWGLKAQEKLEKEYGYL